MWNVGNLVEGLVLSSNFDGDVAVYQVIALCLAIFYCMTYRELIHGETFPQSAYVLLTTKGAEHVGVVDINLVRLLHLRHRLVVCIEKVQQFSPLHAGEIVQDCVLVDFQIGGEFCYVHVVRHVVSQE